MTSPNGNIFRATGPLCGEATGDRGIPLTKASDAELWCFLWSAPEQTTEQTMETPMILKRHRGHNDTTVLWALEFKAALSIVLSRLKQSNYRWTNEVFTLKYQLPFHGWRAFPVTGSRCSVRTSFEIHLRWQFAKTSSFLIPIPIIQFYFAQTYDWSGTLPKQL